VLTLEIVASPAMNGVLFRAMLYMIARTMLDLLTMNTNPTVAVKATNLCVQSRRDRGHTHLYPLMGFHPIPFEYLLLFTFGKKKFIGHVGSRAA
jgi:hypothetical protein